MSRYALGYVHEILASNGQNMMALQPKNQHNNKSVTGHDLLTTEART